MADTSSIVVATREVMWNVSHPIHTVLMYSVMVVSLLVGIAGVLRRAESWIAGKPSKTPLRNLFTRVGDLTSNALLQQRTNKELGPAIFHSLIYLGFLVLLFTTTMVFIDHDLGIKIYQGPFYLAVTVLSDLFGLGLLIGLLLAAHRRYLSRPAKLHNGLADSILLVSLALLVVQGFLLEGLRIHATGDEWREYSPVGNVVAHFFWMLSDSATRLLHMVMWWFHTLTVFAVIAVAPYTKFFHIISSSANIFFARARRPYGRLEPVGDIEKIMEEEEEISFGLGSITDYTWKHLLDLDACTSCGRCQEVCPAYLSGKPLSPKWVILDARNHHLALQAEEKLNTASSLPHPMRDLDRSFLTSLTMRAGGITGNGEGYHYQHPETRAPSTPVQESILQLGKNPEARIAGEVMDPNVFWSCTTCMACVAACPVSINHVDHIVGNRRNMVMMHGEVPNEAQGTLRALETRGNPFGAPEDRFNWAEGLDVPVVSEGDEVEYLYWVGCVSAYDKRKQKIARSMVKLLQAAGVSFGVLGEAECCTGDPARRLGDELLFQTLAKQNCSTLKGVQFKKIVANCPHCFNSLKNEYGEFGGVTANDTAPEIIHHSVLLEELLHAGRLPLREAEEFEEYTFHDPCYLGRYNGEYDAPRETLVQIGGITLTEMPRHGEKGLCCGAGGGHFWMDLKLGERVNVLRVDEAAETGATRVATGCPFCLQMMEDGVKLTDREGELEVRDIAEVLAERLY